MDALDKTINTVLRLSLEQNKEEARLRRNARDEESAVERKIDDYMDRCALRFPIKPREQMPQLSDAAYLAYQKEAIKNRAALLWILIGLTLQQAVKNEESEADAEYDKLFLRNGF